MVFVVLLLNAAAALGFRNGALHAAGLTIRIHDDKTTGIAGGSTDGLNERPLTPHHTFFIGIEYSHERYFGQIKPLPQQIDADDDVNDALAELPQNLDPLQSFNI